MYRLVAGVVLMLMVGTAAVTLAAGGVVVSGGSQVQQRLVRELLTKLQPTRIVSVTFQKSTHFRFHGQEMDLVGAEASVRTWWDENFFAAAFVRASKTLDIPEPVLIAFDTDGFTPVHGPGPAGPRASSKAVASYLSGLRKAAAGAKAQVLHLRVFRPGPIGVAITLKVSDPARFLKYRVNSVLRAFDSPPTGVFARYLGVLGSSGTLVWAVGNFPSSSSVYIQAKLRGCNPTPGTMPIGVSIPPCPA